MKSVEIQYNPLFCFPDDLNTKARRTMTFPDLSIAKHDATMKDRTTEFQSDIFFADENDEKNMTSDHDDEKHMQTDHDDTEINMETK